MPRPEFHDRPYDDGTLSKLRIFQLFVQEWCPVFLSRGSPPFEELHVFDFFAGPGTDAAGEPGSPLRVLGALRKYQALAGWDRVRKTAHFFDLDPSKIARLSGTIAERGLAIPGVVLDIQQIEFSSALVACRHALENPRAAKLLIIDQFGVDAVSDDVFRVLISYPTTDFLFFLSTSTLNRFRDHPAIKQKIPHPEDSYHVHRAAFEYFKGLIPPEKEVYLGQFSIRKRSNIYGIIFGSQHPLGIHKFLQVAWRTDQIAGEANFDVDRENIGTGEMLLAIEELKPKKIQSFESALAEGFRSQRFRDEADVLHFCIEHGMTAQHAKLVISKLRGEGLFSAGFRVPDIRRFQSPRPIIYR